MALLGIAREPAGHRFELAVMAFGVAFEVWHALGVLGTMAYQS